MVYLLSILFSASVFFTVAEAQVESGEPTFDLATIGWQWGFRGEKDPEIPRKRKTSVCDQKNLIDIHTHVGCFGYKNAEGCWISPSMRASKKFKRYPMAFGIKKSKMRRHGDKYFFGAFSQKIKSSSCVKAAVMLALDGAYTEGGEFDKKYSELRISNKFVASGVRAHKNLLWAASVNPQRKDWREQLEFAHRNGAQFIKLIPPIMRFKLDDKKFEEYYLTLKKYNLPILVHLDDEGSFSREYPEFAGVWRAEYPLSLGVKVVVAHMGSRGNSAVPNNFFKRPGEGTVLASHYRQLKELFANPKYKGLLYAEISALPIMRTRPQDLYKVVEDMKLFEGRLLWGSDYPLNHWFLTSYWNSDFAKKYRARLRSRGWNMKTAWTALTERWDRLVLFQYAMGVEEPVFHASREFLLKNGHLKRDGRGFRPVMR